MERVQGIGGIFFKARDPESLREWYRRHLGIPVEDWGGCVFRWGGMPSAGAAHDADEPDGGPTGSTVWSVFDAGSDYFAPSAAPFMVNYRVRDLRALLAMLRDEGCDVDPRVDESELGIFGWVMDPEGNRVELWQPPVGR